MVRRLAQVPFEIAGPRVGRRVATRGAAVRRRRIGAIAGRVPGSATVDRCVDTACVAARSVLLGAPVCGRVRSYVGLATVRRHRCRSTPAHHRRRTPSVEASSASPAESAARLSSPRGSSATVTSPRVASSPLDTWSSPAPIPESPGARQSRRQPAWPQRRPQCPLRSGRRQPRTRRHRAGTEGRRCGWASGCTSMHVSCTCPEDRTRRIHSSWSGLQHWMK